MSDSPIEGIKVLDVGMWVAGPGAAAILGDLGAEVIKIEDRIHGDAQRGMTAIMKQYQGKEREELNRNYNFEYYNRNKRGMTLNLQCEGGKQILRRLVKRSDVFVINFRSGVAEKLGVEYETISQHNPQIIYALASASGLKGPNAHKPGLDFTTLAMSAMMYAGGEPDTPPLILKGGMADQMGAVVLALAIMTALFNRERTGIGQMVEASGLGSMIFLQASTFAAKLITGVEFPRRSRHNLRNPLWNHYKCADGSRIGLAMLQPDRYWHDFCKVIGIDELENDPRFESMEARNEYSKDLVEILDRIFATRPIAEWSKLLDEGGDFIYAPVHTVTQTCEDPQVLENEYIIDFDHPSWGKTKMLGCPYKFSKTPAKQRMPAPEFGQHTEEILLELGYDWEDIVKFRDEEVI